jgi:hypothetical protein
MTISPDVRPDDRTGSRGLQDTSLTEQAARAASRYFDSGSEPIERVVRPSDGRGGRSRERGKSASWRRWRNPA